MRLQILVMVSMVCISTLVRAYGQQRCNMMQQLNATQVDTKGYTFVRQHTTHAVLKQLHINC